MNTNTKISLNTFYWSTRNVVMDDVMGRKHDSKRHQKIVDNAMVCLRAEGMNEQEIFGMLNKIMVTAIRAAVDWVAPLVDENKLTWWRGF